MANRFLMQFALRCGLWNQTIPTKIT